MNFNELDLHPDLLDGIDALNYTTATPIQAQAIPLILEGHDLIGVAQTGTGKTAAFVLPVLDRIISSGEAGFTQALIIVPTRELAVQIDQVIEAYSYFTGVSSMPVYGGGDAKSFGQEKTALSSGADIIVATPGRLIAHINMGYVDFSRLRFLVLDEADRMLDMGFQPDLLKIVEKTNPQRQSLLFSATMPPTVAKLAKSFLRNPKTISIALSKPAAGVTQGAFVVHEPQKMPLIVELLKDMAGQRIVIFGSTKQAVSTLYQKLKSRGLPVGHMSSDIDQDAREQVMLAFRNSQIDILVATDVVSRGIDIDSIDVVINYDVPRDAEDYVHRIGRTARADKKGTALTLIGPMDQQRFVKIEKLIDRTVEKYTLPQSIGEGPVYDPFRKPQSEGNHPPQRRPQQGQRMGAPRPGNFDGGRQAHPQDRPGFAPTDPNAPPKKKKKKRRGPQRPRPDQPV